MTELQEQIVKVAAARKASEAARTAYADALAAWEVANAGMVGEKLTAAEIVTQEEAKLRALTLAAFSATGEKKPCPGVGIRELTNLMYDSNTALTWAKEHKIALKLDVTAFERMCRTTAELRPNFVAVSTDYQATIATDLTPYVQVPAEGGK
jgi:hypothetical protein